MKLSPWILSIVPLVIVAMITGCAATGRTETDASGSASARVVLSAESFLADIAQNVAGDRLRIRSLIPLGSDPHGFQATPQDLASLSSADLLVVNGAGLEDEGLEKLFAPLRQRGAVLEAAAGLKSRPVAGHDHEADEVENAEGEPPHGNSDPHFWLDPNLVMTYVSNIREGLTRLDPAGRDTYAANADKYTQSLRELDQWIQQQVGQLPKDRLVLVTNHESLGYFADRYGFRVVGTIVPSVSPSASPSAQQLAKLVDQVKAAGAKAIFLETGTNPQLAQQVAREAGVRLVTQIYTHSLSEASGPAPTYLAMMRHNVQTIVDALR